jgi:uncharacterized SAM-binding protein YcdF (DUF218 family)
MRTRLSSHEAISQFLFLEDELKPVDLAIVLGNNWRPTMDPAIELVKRGFTEHVLVTGSWRGDAEGRPTEAARFVEYALERGVPEEVLIQESEATNTKENFTFTIPLVEARIGWERVRTVAVVCLSFHTRRALLTARRWWPEHVEYVFHPVYDERDIRPDTWWRTESGTQRAMAELRRIGEYALQDDLKLD